MARPGDLLAAYPWLRLLGTDLLGRLDFAELADPHPCALALGPTVVAYRRGACPRPGRVSLCSLIPAARIGPARVALLNEAERVNPEIVLVEYAGVDETGLCGGLRGATAARRPMLLHVNDGERRDAL
ncbi:hypothetical protein ACTWPT_24310 [Nonomuraea sp. 3N208]|uniref:hypothetical protein n=1 Tax=Nonomuraea sp. 3N208 TaxID=3457421 RepID=UPI003FD01F8D